ncbi:MAG: NTP transferase domain-containing protein [Deltaproteobacteria bacterium]|nr:NTP transferase domain-containing protein [Deltaproteobacteria bacterium]
MNTIVTIAVRMKSTRLAGKAMLDIAGQSLIGHLIQRVSKAKRIKAVVLCTSNLPEDAILLEEAEKYAIGSVAGSADDVFARFEKAALREGADHVVRVTGDNPLTDPEYIDRLIGCHLEQKNEYTSVEGLPMGVASEVISVETLKKGRLALQDPTQSEYMTFLLKDTEKYKVGMLKADRGVNRPQYRLTVDTSEDLELIRMIYRRLYRPEKYFSLQQVVDLMDQYPAFSKINSEIEQRSLPV